MHAAWKNANAELYGVVSSFARDSVFNASYRRLQTSEVP